MTIKKPICFVAMAFEKSDTDKFYENLVLPVLKRNNIKPIVINRRQSNDDLNIQIIESLQECDFVIADLTYARPSVYFEAGFAQSKCTVIYTVRKDHLKPGQPENLRVHFDLQMKPLITWTNENDIQFSRKIEKRIVSTFLNDWNREKTQNENEKNEIEKFNRISLEDRLIMLRKVMIDNLTKTSGSEWIPIRFSHDTASYGLAAKGKINNVYSILETRKNYRIVTVQSYQSIINSNLWTIKNIYDPWKLASILLRKIDKRVLNKNIIASHFVLGLKPISAPRIESVFNDLEIESPGKIYFSMSNTHLENILCFSNIYFITDIESKAQLNNQILWHMKEYLSNIN